MMKRKQHYHERDAMALDVAGNYYINHVCAMTHEHLMSKSSIAAELAYRDYTIARLQRALEDALEWIDAVPSDTQLPAMPGFDRDPVNRLLDEARRGCEL